MLMLIMLLGCFELFTGSIIPMNNLHEPGMLQIQSDKNLSFIPDNTSLLSSSQKNETSYSSPFTAYDTSAKPKIPVLYIEVWNGKNNRVGHLGDVQDDFNVPGHVYSKYPLSSFTYSLNGGEDVPLNTFVYRRIVNQGDFNADIPVAMMKTGVNIIKLKAVNIHNQSAESVVKVTKTAKGEYPFPVNIHWSSVRNIEDVGHCSDGRWEVGPDGLRTVQIGYDRVFLIGNKKWKDYEVACKVTIHGLSKKNGPQSWIVRHAGFCLRWSGHSLEDNKPGDQPKWGLHPRGGIVWLTIVDGKFPPIRQFYPGDSESSKTFEPFTVSPRKPFWMKGRCETLPDNNDGAGVTKYSFKVWDVGTDEPAEWDYQEIQTSAKALRTGGCALVAHELDASFGDISIINLPASE